MFKKIISLILSLYLCLSLGVSAFAVAIVEEVENELVFSDMTFDDYTGGTYGTNESLAYSEHPAASSAVGPHGESDKAIGFVNTNSTKFRVFPMSGKTSASSKTVIDTDFLKCSYDVKITCPTDFSYIPEASRYKDFAFLEGQIVLLDNSGNDDWLKITPAFYINATTGQLKIRVNSDDANMKPITSDIWYTVESSYDFSVSGKITYEINVINKSTGTADASFAGEISGRLSTATKFTNYYFTSYYAYGATFVFDNFKFTNNDESLAFISYKSDTELEISDNVSFTVRIPKEVSSAGVYFGDAKLADIVGSDGTVFYKVTVPVVDFATELVLGTPYTMSLKAVYNNNDEGIVEYTNPVTIKEIEGFNVCSLQFRLNGSDYNPAQQLQETNVFGVRGLIVSGGEDTSGIMILTLREDKKLISVAAKDFTAGDSLQNIELTLPAAGRLNNPVLECMFVKDLKTCIPYTPSYKK